MNKKDFIEIINASVKDVWHGRRSMNPVKEQTELLVESLWPLYSKENESLQRVQNLQDDIKKWSDETFGKYRTAMPMAHHLKKEADELINALDRLYEGTYCNSDITEIGVQELIKKNKRILSELADCLILLMDCAAHEQINIDKLITSAEEKLEVNKKRKWGIPDKNGVIEHIEE